MSGLRSLSEIARRSGVYALGDLLVRGPEFVLLPLYTAVLSPGDFGIVAIAAAVTMVARPILTLGVQAAALKFYFDFDEAGDRAASTLR